MIKKSILNVFLFYQFIVLVSSLTVSKEDQVELFKRGALEATNRAIDRTQAKAQRAHDKVTGVGHVISDHFGVSSIKNDMKAAWHPESAGKQQKRDLESSNFIKRGMEYIPHAPSQKRGINEKIDRAQASVTGFHDRVKGVKDVVKDHAMNNGFVQDVHSAWHGEHHKRSEIILKRGLNSKIDHAQAKVTDINDRRHAVVGVVKDHAKNNALVHDITAAWGYGKPHHKRDLNKREAVSIDQALGRSHSGHSRLAKRDLVDSANRAIDRAQDDITDARNKVHAVKEVVGQHVKNDPLVSDVKAAWDTGDANLRKIIIETYLTFSNNASNLRFLIALAGLFTNALPSIATPVLELKDGSNMEYKRDLVNVAVGQSSSMVMQKRGRLSDLSNKIPGINGPRAQAAVGKASQFIHGTAATPSIVMGGASKAGMAVKNHPVTATVMGHVNKVKQTPLYQAARKDTVNLASYVSKKGSSVISKVGSRVKKV
ncbi:uncharacterized protein FA14DRAFT_180366 [Meira miltonrushii]|uniref:Uncharacterized protein n=1 Tax=Meira miltonrushii TaxID=1280837 RepID=A0A316V7Y2_9BASI|nr:uncharacterized protein FA14DRAFT_180366 [Meira miltonrushii]PWN33729.1 hypothetical protein FA14DRAFT_180366 [Meira miltonrushii]